MFFRFKLALCFLVLNLFFMATAVAKEKNQNSLFVFVGELVALERVGELGLGTREKLERFMRGEKVNFPFDNEYKATFKVLKQIYGKYQNTAITFDVYDHFGRPDFSEFKHLLMFVSKREDGSFYHEKYQYFDLYKTKNGRWATCGSPYKYDHNLDESKSAELIEFKGIIAYDVQFLLKQNKQHLKYFYPTEFFTIIGGYAVCNGLGAYVPDLFEVKRKGVLTARGLF